MSVRLIAGLALLALIVVFAWPRIVCPWREQVALRRLSARTGLTYTGRRVLGIPRVGRAFGSYLGRACALERHKGLEVHPALRILCSVQNRDDWAFRLVAAVPGPDPDASGGAAHPALWVAQSTPPGLAERAIVEARLAKRIPPVAAGIRASEYHLSLSGHLLRFEHLPRGLCALPPDRAAEALQAVLEALCACAASLEAMVE
jgi:hypothetical protein